MSLGERLKNVKVGKSRSEALWKGPESNHELGGITFSMLSRFLVCKERFRIHVIEGLKPTKQFNHRIEYGQMWHECEEAHAVKKDWHGKLQTYALGLSKQYPLAQEDINKWYNVCKVQFPLYVAHWSKQPDTMQGKPVFQEKVFDVAYRLPSGRRVRLRGKWDSVYLFANRLWNHENKTKGDVNIPQLQRQLSFDLQTMMYVVALDADKEEIGNYMDANRITSKPWQIAGIRYNVVRRPLSGGKGTIVRHKASKNKPEESYEEYYARLAEYIVEEPDHYFTRFNVELSSIDIERFKKECLHPILENLCDWYDDQIGRGQWNIDDYKRCTHWRHPYGVYNVLDEGGSSDIDGYLLNKSEVGLERVETLFEELQEGTS